jgi:hypothetical protein
MAGLEPALSIGTAPREMAGSEPGFDTLAMFAWLATPRSVAIAPATHDE